MGIIEEEFRLPLCTMSEANKIVLRDLLKKYGLLNKE
jgi:hypothetical protein